MNVASSSRAELQTRARPEDGWDTLPWLLDAAERRPVLDLERDRSQIPAPLSPTHRSDTTPGRALPTAVNMRGMGVIPTGEQQTVVREVEDRIAGDPACLTLRFSGDREDSRETFPVHDIMTGALWKAIHRQPVPEECRTYRGRGSETLFERRLCVSSDTALTEAEQNRVVNIVMSCRGPRVLRQPAGIVSALVAAQ